jgi:hypothetical protein
VQAKIKATTIIEATTISKAKTILDVLKASATDSVLKASATDSGSNDYIELINDVAALTAAAVMFGVADGAAKTSGGKRWRAGKICT